MSNDILDFSTKNLIKFTRTLFTKINLGITVKSIEPSKIYRSAWYASFWLNEKKLGVK